MENKSKMIGVIIATPQQVKSEFLTDINKDTKKACLVFVEIYLDKRYGAIAKVFERNSMTEFMFNHMTKKENKALQKRIDRLKKKEERDAKLGIKPKPLDTSKWVKPDEESIRLELIKNLFALEILKEDSVKYGEYYGKAGICYSILHSHSPRNPQTLSNFVFDPYFEKIMNEFNSIESKKYWKEFNQAFKSKNTDWDKRREDYQIWKSKCLRNMIIKDKHPELFKDI